MHQHIIICSQQNSQQTSNIKHQTNSKQAHNLNEATVSQTGHTGNRHFIGINFTQGFQQLQDTELSPTTSHARYRQQKSLLRTTANVNLACIQQSHTYKLNYSEVKRRARRTHINRYDFTQQALH